MNVYIRLYWAIVGVLFLNHLLIGQDHHCDNVIIGRVLDITTQEPLPYATVSIEETDQGTAADENGAFELVGICDNEIHLVARFIGYKTMVHHHDLHHEDPIIFLAPDETMLESIVIEESRLDAFQSLAVQNLELDQVELLSTSIGDLTEEISGISMLNTGANISKPIVHGLHSNRVLVMNDGLRHGYQVWGEGHAPEIDPSHVAEIEVVKGAGTVKYGPEALGGVVLYNAKRPTLDEKINGSMGTSYQSNGRTHSAQVSLNQGSHRFAWNTSGFGLVQGDLNAPDYNLSNTGKKEYGGSFNTLFHLPTLELEISASYLDQQIGILRGSLVGNLQDLQTAINRGTPSPTFEPTFRIQNPRHDIQHGLLKSNLSYFLGDHIIKLQYGIQRNVRKEFDVRRGELNERPVIDLELLSQSFTGEWIQPTIGRWSGNSGMQIFTQRSINEPGSNPINFVPNYDVLNAGVYTVQSLDIDETVMELGVRMDYQTLNVRDTIRDVTTYANEVSFTNATFTLGFRKALGEHLTIFSNIGTAWRPPNVSELYSFGYHFSRIQFGLWRYTLQPNISTPLNQVFDQTDREVPSEKSLKWVTGLQIKNKKINSEWIIHANRISDYIFLRPFGITTNVAGTFPYFIYEQTNALFLGSDWDMRYKHTDLLASEVKVSYVYARELKNNQAFIEIPPLNVIYDLEFNKGRWSGGFNLNYMASQWYAPHVIEPGQFQNGGAEINPDEIFDFMPPPNAYILVGASAKYQHESITIELKANNILDTSYRAYTDRLRYFSDAPGRNLSISMSANI